MSTKQYGSICVTFKPESERSGDECAWETSFTLRFNRDDGKGPVGHVRVWARFISGCVEQEYSLPYPERCAKVFASLKTYSMVQEWPGGDAAWWNDSESASKLVAHYGDEAARLGYPVPTAELLDAAQTLGWAFAARRAARVRVAA